MVSPVSIGLLLGVAERAAVNCLLWEMETVTVIGFEAIFFEFITPLTTVVLIIAAPLSISACVNV